MSSEGLTCGGRVGGRRGRIHFKAHYWQVLLPCHMGLLIRLLLDTAIEFSQVVSNLGEGKRGFMPRWNLRSFNSLVLKVTYHYFYLIPFIRSKLLSLVHTQGEEFTQGCKLDEDEAGIIAILEATYTSIKLK